MGSPFLCLSHLLQFCNVVREKAFLCWSFGYRLLRSFTYHRTFIVAHWKKNKNKKNQISKEQQSKPIIRATNRLFCLILNSRHNLQFTKCILHLILNDTWFRIIVFEPPDHISLLKVLHSEFSFVTLFLLYPLLLLNCFFFYLFLILTPFLAFFSIYCSLFYNCLSLF